MSHPHPELGGPPELPPDESQPGVDLVDEVRPWIDDALRQAVNDGDDDAHQPLLVIRRTTRRWANQAHRRQPMNIPVVLEA